MANNKFKVGDVVICKNTSNSAYLELNKEYTVLRTYLDSNDILIKSTPNDAYYYNHNLFILKKELFQLIEIY